ncbi:TD and POZ domain-containing protein 3-like [Parasteatoda tepidariorum]|uniref:TD and POZ domain-containing protein 3-like n=1 Tax=Parasteatoda tepidariorum TaxID=114398 RepID=UPI00077F9529|nr:TD and POZ domain-containing protein 3-like [Parasteatoda tepidariorum]
MSDLIAADEVDCLMKYGVLTKKEVFKWCIHASAIQNSTADDKRSDFFTFGPSKGDKFYFQLPASKNSGSQFSVFLCRLPSQSPENQTQDKIKIKVSLALLDLRDRLHNTCERIMEDCDKVQAVFDRSCYDKYHSTFLRSGFIVIYCALDVNEVIQDSEVDKETPKIVSFTDSLSTKDLIDDFSNLLEKGLHSDVTLAVKGNDFPAHRAILSARSPIFAAMFEHDTKEKEENIIDIVDIPSNAIQQLLCFLYTGKTGPLTVQDALSLFIASDKYAVPSLRKQCSNYLCSNLNTEISLNVLIVASQHQDDDLKNAAIQGVLDNAVQVLKSDEWLSFLQEYPEIANSIILQLAIKSQRE